MPITYLIAQKERQTGKTKILHGSPGLHPDHPGMTEKDAAELFADLYGQKPPYRTKTTTILIVPREAPFVKPRKPPGQGTLPRDYHEYRRRMGWE
jgi:hypothetical protein